MRTTSVFFFILFIVSLSSAQVIQGRYYNNYGEEIVISDGILYLIVEKGYNHNQTWWSQDTLAMCEISQINKSLIEVTSLESDLYKTWSIESTNEDRDDDSIKIVFTIPYQRNDLEITVGTYPNFKDFKNHNHEKFVMIPRCTKYDFEIKPTEWIAEHDVGITYGRICFSSIELTIEEFEVGDNINKIEIKIPPLDDYFFSKYHVYKEFIYIKNEKLYWKGKVYKRQNK